MTTTTSSFKIVELPKRQLAYVRHVGPYQGDSELFGRLFNQVMGWAGPKGLLQNSNMEVLSMYHDDPESVPPEQQRISVGITVPEGTEVDGDIHLMELPAAKYAVGSFELLPDGYKDAWNEMMQYLQREQLQPSGVALYESYKNDPKTHPEGKHLVDICISLV